MEVKQSKVASFFIDNHNEEETLAYIEKNAPLLKTYLLIFSHEISQLLQQRCDAWKLCCVYNSCALKNKGTIEKIENEKKEDKSVKTNRKKEIFRTIRSGEMLNYEGDLVVVGNVNDGASINSEGTLAIFGIIEGDISCNGAYLILSTCHRGKVIFQGEVINDIIEGTHLKMFYKHKQELKIKELI